MKIKKGDMVQVITGTDKGKTGRIIKIFLKRSRLIIEGVNMVKKHARPTQENPQGGIIEKEASIHVSNVMLIAGNKPTRVGYKNLEDGQKVKYAKITGEVIN